MPEGLGGALLQLAIALIASGVMVRLLTLRQDRRKIAGEASTQEANAASVLTGASLQMVEASQKSAHDAHQEAQDAREELTTARQANQQLATELNRARWKIYSLEVQEAILEAALTEAGVKIPPKPFHAGDTHDDYAPPELDDDGEPE